MATQSWTELFFLDEATALSAGHRPCFLCRREAAKRFSAAWAKGNGGALPGAGEIDATLHLERLDGKRKRLHPLAGPPQSLPDGAMFAAGDRAYLVAGGRLLLWTPDGPRPVESLPEINGLLTPPSTLRALAAGYRPVLHESATG